MNWSFTIYTILIGPFCYQGDPQKSHSPTPIEAGDAVNTDEEYANEDMYDTEKLVIIIFTK